MRDVLRGRRDYLQHDIRQAALSKAFVDKPLG